MALHVGSLIAVLTAIAVALCQRTVDYDSDKTKDCKSPNADLSTLAAKVEALEAKLRVSGKR